MSKILYAKEAKKLALDLSKRQEEQKLKQEECDLELIFMRIDTLAYRGELTVTFDLLFHDIQVTDSLLEKLKNLGYRQYSRKELNFLRQTKHVDYLTWE